MNKPIRNTEVPQDLFFIISSNWNKLCMMQPTNVSSEQVICQFTRLGSFVISTNMQSTRTKSQQGTMFFFFGAEKMSQTTGVKVTWEDKPGALEQMDGSCVYAVTNKLNRLMGCEDWPMDGQRDTFIHISFILFMRLTVMKPSSRPESGFGGACNRSMDHFSMIDATWLFSVLRILKPVMFTPLYR